MPVSLATIKRVMRSLKKLFISIIRVFKRDQRTGLHIINVARALYMFFPNTSGSYRQLSNLALQEVNLVIPALSNFSEVKLRASSVAEEQISSDALRLNQLFKEYGSDKSTGHNYHLVYASLINPVSVRKILEIGLGTGDSKLASNMGVHAIPGASLRAFRDFYPNAQVIGLEIDKKILFQ